MNTTLKTRGKTHGDFSDNAQYAQDIKDIIHATRNYSLLVATQREALDMIAHKIARICAGDPNHKDHWHDIAGYAQLVEERIKSGE